MQDYQYEQLGNELAKIMSALLEASEAMLAKTKQDRAAVASNVERMMGSMTPAETGIILTNMAVELQRGLSQTGQVGVAFSVKPTGFSIADKTMIGVAVTNGNTTVSVGVEPEGDLSGIRGGGVKVEHTY